MGIDSWALGVEQQRHRLLTEVPPSVLPLVVLVQGIVEGAWHVMVIGAATPWVARRILASRAVMAIVVATLAIGAVYHLALYPSG